MITFSLFLATTALFLQGILLPKLSILAFAPFLAIIMLKCKFHNALWLSLLSGAIVDLYSDDPMGLHALNYVLVTSLLYRFRSYLSHDHEGHLTLFSGIVSAISTTIQLLLLFLFEKKVPFSGKWIIIDIIAMPLIDAFYAFVWFAAPLKLIQTLDKMWKIFWIKKKTSLD